MRILLSIFALLAFLGSAAAQPATTSPNISNTVGNLSVSKLNSGTSASNTTFWRGDGTWATPGGAGVPGGSSGDIQTNNAGAFGAFTPGTGCVTFLTTPSSANLRGCLTDEAGTGAAYFVGGAIGTPASGTATNLTGLPLSTGVTGTLPVANGGTGDTGTAWTSYSPTITASSGTFTTVSATGFYKQIGKTVFIRITITITTNGTAAGSINATLPVNPLASVEMILPGRIVNTSFNAAGRVRSDATPNNAVTGITDYAGLYPGATGNVIVLQGVYEAN